ncbi:C2H2 finger domain [Cordyceps militaris]|uniref:C2H2 finger domain n=1 Tax=Cordyceps militaris TaxID=73501 RepID=A0A2H4S8T7_CORMI|nr:C2H2 finger domain [Cordyceps militaris]
MVAIKLLLNEDTQYHHHHLPPYNDPSFDARPHPQNNSNRSTQSRLMNADNPVRCCFSFLGCWSRFQNFKHWKDHMQTMHLGYKYVCPTCSYETGRIGNLRMHIFRRQDTHPSCSMSVLNDAFRSSLPTELQCHQKNCEEVFKGTSAWHRWASHAWVHIQENQYQDLNFRSSLGRR